jgi:excinuclease UvrABC nuclease subunit
MNMAAKSYSLTYQGYWRDKNRGGVPAESGVYTVYASTYSAQSDTIALRKVIYIGQAENAKVRLANHEKENDWKKHLLSGEEVSFSFAPVQAADRDRVEAALIHHHKPPVNTQYVDSFPFDQTTITTSGRNMHLAASFTVYRKD